MTDRELLEAAAKAAAKAATRPLPMLWDPDEPGHWNPLTNDGDALRLAVKLRIDIASDDELIAAEGPNFEAAIHEPRANDSYAATRRAIVRAAAALAQEPA